jgi:hypothetical protein
LTRVAVLLLGLLALAAVAAHAGHELSFYPSYYPQEIRVERLDPASAAARLQQNALHAYVGTDPFPGAPVPKPLEAVESLAGYLVLTFNPAEAAGRDVTTRCTQARSLLPSLGGPVTGYTFHPYPVTPYHGDYLHHADLAGVARERAAAPGAAGPGLRVRARGTEAERLLAGRAAASTGAWDAVLETAPLAELLRQDDDKPWVKEGWFHAYRLLLPTVTDAGRRQAADELGGRLATGSYGSAVERLNLERALLRRLTEGCERVVVGYLTRREVYSAEFSAGIENVGADAHTGLHSPVFLRTAKLRTSPGTAGSRSGSPTRRRRPGTPSRGSPTRPAGSSGGPSATRPSSPLPAARAGSATGSPWPRSVR